MGPGMFNGVAQALAVIAVLILLAGVGIGLLVGHL